MAADIDESRLELAKVMGADVVINTSKQDLKQVIKNVRKVGVMRSVGVVNTRVGVMVEDWG